MKKSLLVSFVFVLVFLSSCLSSSIPEVPSDAFYKDPQASPEDRARDLLQYMTLDEKLGQMTQIDKRHFYEEEDIAIYQIGSILSGGGAAPSPNTPESWADMYDGFQRIAMSTRLAIPMIYGIDAVHGHNNVYGAVIFPHNIGLGATGNLELVEEVAHITAIEVAGTGIDWTFAPCVAVPRDERWGRTYEGFSEDPLLTAEMGAAAIRGYQGSDLSAEDTILATAKHFVSDGGTQGGEDQGNAVISEEELRSIHLLPYEYAIEESVGSIMASYSSWNGEKVHGSQYLLTDILKTEMGFNGLLVSDWAAVKQLPGSYEEQIAASINAGVDMVMVPDDYIEFLEAISECVRKKTISMDRIDEAVFKILRVKFQLGLFENPLTNRQYTETIGSEEHREVARQAVRESIVMLKNDATLPLSSDASQVIVAGTLANNLGPQCGGWTISWQGERGNEFTLGTTIFQAMEEALPGSEVIYDRKGENATGEEDYAIVVIGESPYAEYKGDKDDLSLPQSDIELIRLLKSKGLKVVTVLVSGRPRILNEALELSDAFLAVWLPGTEGVGVSDVLLGNYAPTGKLPHTWPASMDQIPINGEEGSGALFPMGFGLTY
ncbi:MAG: glycoside hydrolase family 3 C-terminal domain-containing protein [Spirochaetaceae bacterium]|jgi:beta-glucosidase|nr:glycoside hydrolase family 3 C-terminal domain-containing protein [Spirochaetaceae bacterium]